MILAILIVASIYYYKEYSEQDFDQIVYYVLNGVESAAPSVVKGVIETAAIPTILLWLMLCIPTVKNVKKTNLKPIKIPYKNINLLGNKFEIEVKEDPISQNLAYLALSIGLLEKNALGFGFCRAI